MEKAQDIVVCNNLTKVFRKKWMEVKVICDFQVHCLMEIKGID